jgi:hypothetical protein
VTFGWTCKLFPLIGTKNTVLWTDAEKAWPAYARSGGSDQPLEVVARRGGFGIEEFVYFSRDLDFRVGEEFRWKVEPCQECKGTGEVVDSEEGGLVFKCGICWGAGAVLPEGAKARIKK